ncbi:Potassium transporter 5 [Ananas comosus]|uniref:Potassium transporter n=1 Tax=Ananas comosus TaxID=4615 RepID=A0A199VPK6_ANACO|nr:Potassium transporter 5 [Ananas comosus]
MADNSEHTNGSRNEEEVGGECLADSGTASEARGLPSTKKLNRIDSLHLEAGRVQHAQNHGAKVGWGTTLHLAFQSIGVVYGDIGTSPLYVYSSTFTEGIKDKNDLLGVLSLIIYTLILLPLTKYVFIVLRANDNGNGGTFALYSLISRHAKVSFIPNQQAEDAMVSNYKLETTSSRVKRAQWIKEKLENSREAKLALFLITILGTSMVIGDGILTPCISVLSAVSGIKESASSLTEGKIAGISIIILIFLFAVQRFGTDRVGYSFAPIILVWFLLIGGIGTYNIFKHDIGILRAFNPKYIVDYFKRNGKQAWISLGGVVLCITGTEAMFADLGHFNLRAIQIGFSAVLLPSVLLAYIGQAAYLTNFPDNVGDTFYKSIPGPLYWPTFVVAVAAAIIASQAMISGAFAIISQSQLLGCFPRIRIMHTSAEYEGQVYIPELNYALMIVCVAVTAIFKTTDKIGNAYGIAVVSVMHISTLLVTLVMLMIWKLSMWRAALFYVTFGGTELLYISSVFYKFTQGGYLPLSFSAVLMFIMGTWHYVHVQRYKFELKNKVSSDYVRELALRRDLIRLPGIGFLYSELVQGIPPILPHFIEKIPSIHSVLVLVSIKYLPISRVEMKERFLFRHVEPREHRMFQCVVRYGYNDAVEDTQEFEKLLIEHLKVFVYEESFFSPNGHANNTYRVDEEIEFIRNEMAKGVVYLLGETEVVAENDSNFVRKVVIDYIYNFLRKNFRQGGKVMCIPHNSLLRVGMTYEI